MKRIVVVVVVFIFPLIFIGCNNAPNTSPCDCGSTSYVSIRIYDGLELTDDYHGVISISEIPSASQSHKTWHLKICQKYNHCSTYEKNVDGAEIIKVIADW